MFELDHDLAQVIVDLLARTGSTLTSTLDEWGCLQVIWSDLVDRAAPGFASTVEHMHVQTPLDLERELGLRNGQVMHVEMAFDQMFMWRPTPELSGYRVPGVDGLYLCGSGAHPGGGVTANHRAERCRKGLAADRGGR